MRFLIFVCLLINTLHANAQVDSLRVYLGNELWSCCESTPYAMPLEGALRLIKGGYNDTKEDYSVMRVLQNKSIVKKMYRLLSKVDTAKFTSMIDQDSFHTVWFKLVLYPTNQAPQIYWVSTEGYIISNGRKYISRESIVNILQLKCAFQKERVKEFWSNENNRAMYGHALGQDSYISDAVGNALVNPFNEYGGLDSAKIAQERPGCKLWASLVTLFHESEIRCLFDKYDIFIREFAGIPGAEEYTKKYYMGENKRYLNSLKRNDCSFD